MKLNEIRDIYTAILPDATFHYEARSKPDKYIVWAEDGQGSSTYADNHMDQQAISGTTDLFTKDEYDPVFDQIQQAMNKAQISWRLESIQHEEKTGYIHYEWSWEVCNKLG